MADPASLQATLMPNRTPRLGRPGSPEAKGSRAGEAAPTVATTAAEDEAFGPVQLERLKVEVAEATLTPHVGTYTSELGKISIDVREGRLHLKMPWDTDWVPMEAMSEVSFFRKAYDLVLNFNEGGVEVAMGVYKVQAKRAGG